MTTNTHLYLENACNWAAKELIRLVEANIMSLICIMVRAECIKLWTAVQNNDKGK